MQFPFNPSVPAKTGRTQMLRVMKLTAVILLAACLQVSANGYSQKVTLNMQNVTFEKVFKEIKRQTGFLFLYNNLELKKVGKISVSVKDEDIEVVLTKCLSYTGFTYKIVDRTIVLNPKPVIPQPVIKNVSDPVFISTLIDIKGKITDDEGQPLENVTILIRGTGKGTKTDANGNFSINAEPNSTLIFDVEVVEVQDHQ
jgi:hypothetical protein